MRPRHRRAPEPLRVDAALDVDDSFEQWVERLARLVIHLTTLADRYEGAVVDGLPAATVSRVALLRSTSESGRDTLVGLALWDRPDIAQGSAKAGGVEMGSALTARTLIGQAQGVLMHRCHVGAGEALERLLAASRAHGITLGQVAREVMAVPFEWMPDVAGTGNRRRSHVG